jgi:hypothetical protein
MENNLIENQNLAIDPSIDSHLSFVNVVDSAVEEPNKLLYPIYKPNQAVNVVPVTAETWTGNTLTFVENNIQPDFTIARDVYVEGVMNISCALTSYTTATGATAANFGASIPLLPGISFGLAADPFQEIISSCVPTVNDQQLGTYYNQEQKTLVLQASNNKKNQALKYGPFADDMVADYSSAFLTQFNNLASGNEAVPQSGFIPNGAWDIGYSNVLNNTTLYPYTPTAVAAGATAGNTASYYIQVPFKSSLTGIAPWSWNDSEDGKENGIRGVRKFGITFNLGSGTRVLRSLRRVSYDTNKFLSFTCTLDPNQPFVSAPKLYYKLITPPIAFSLEKSPLNIIPMLRIERNVKTLAGPADATGVWNALTGYGASVSMQTDNITLSRVPSLIAIYARPSSLTIDYGDFNYALGDKPLTINWDNQMVCSSLNVLDLYRMYVNNGGQDSFLIWSGRIVQSPSYTGGAGAVATMNMKGPLILLRPGIDFPISMGLSPNGPCDLKFMVTLNVKNQSLVDGSGANASKLYVWCLYNDFCVTDIVEGKTTVVNKIMSPEAVLIADKANKAVSEDVVENDNIVGGSLLHKMKKAHRKLNHHGGKISAGTLSAGAMPEAKQTKSARNRTRY